MKLPKTARFPGRVEKRRKGALARREINLKHWNRLSNLKHSDFPQTAEKPVTAEEFAVEHERCKRKAAIAEADIAALKKHLRIAA